MPALAVADSLRARGAEVHFVGGRRSEADLVPGAGYPLHHLSVEGLDRRNPLRAARAVGRAGVGAATARRLLQRLEPGVVLGGGGYVSAPVGIAAGSLRIPLVLLEADRRLGVANRALARRARRVFLAFPIAGLDPPRYAVVGRPVPSSVLLADRGAARRRIGIGDDEICLLVFGGSLGARNLNLATVAAFGEVAPCTVLHVCGSRDFEVLKQQLDALGAPAHYRLRETVKPFGDALAAADLVAARAGGSVFELAATGLPAILVPYPLATGDHQTLNAAWMAEGGAAVTVADRELDGPRLAREVGELLSSRGRLRAMAEAALALARPDAAERVADYLMDLVAADGG